MQYPLIMITNDDGIESPGLWAVAEALLPLGEVIVVAPDRQWSGAGRALPHDVTGKYYQKIRTIHGKQVAAYAVDGSPAQAVQHGILEMAPRTPSLVVSGINSGANLSIEITISGTVGAALEAGAFGIPAIAISLEMEQRYYLTGNHAADYAAAQFHAYQFGQQLLAYKLPYGMDILNINIPAKATPDTPYRYTSLSRCRYFTPVAPDRTRGEGRPGYKHIDDPNRTEFNSDVRAILVDKIVSVTPLSLDMTARVADFNAAAGIFQANPVVFSSAL